MYILALTCQYPAGQGTRPCGDRARAGRTRAGRPGNAPEAAADRCRADRAASRAGQARITPIAPARRRARPAADSAGQPLNRVFERHTVEPPAPGHMIAGMQAPPFAQRFVIGRSFCGVSVSWLQNLSGPLGRWPLPGRPDLTKFTPRGKTPAPRRRITRDGGASRPQCPRASPKPTAREPGDDH